MQTKRFGKNRQYVVLAETRFGETHQSVVICQSRNSIVLNTPIFGKDTLKGSGFRMTSSSTFASSENDLHVVPRSQVGIRPFHDIQESSSDEIELGSFGHDPFVEGNIFKIVEINQTEKLNVKKRYESRTWRSTRKNRKNQKATSVPVLDRKHLIDFWKDVYNGEIFSLPTLGAGKSDSIQRISVDVVKQVIGGTYDVDYQVIDCRFSYEYRGGHIVNAINISSASDLSLLFRKPKVLIFHCEFSSIRAPRLARCLRNMDRMKNPYPSLTIPEIYVMEGGYKRFYSLYPELCSPRGYVTMDDLNYRDLCKKEQYKTRSNKKL